MSDAGAPRLVGQTFSHYRVVALLGAGGMGVVYRGEDVRLGRPVAIKFVADDFATDPQALARLRAEARATSALNHPSICTIYDIGTDEHGRPFIVMELMEGHTLRERLGRGHLKVHELVDLGIQIADALQAAHAAGIMHRDIKPANIFLTGRGHAKLLDFGLAKLTEVHANADSTTLGSTELTAAGTTLGTVAYMSPEQATGEELDGRTDLFSLGVVLYECATGRQPFEGKTHAVILSAILNRVPVPPSALNPELPARLQEIILTCLEKDRELRYQSAADLRADLKRVRRDIESGRLHVGMTTALAPADESSGTVPVTARHRTPESVATDSGTVLAAQRSIPRAWLAAGVLLIAGIAAGGICALSQARRPSPTAPPAVADSRNDTVSAGVVQNRLALARSSLAAGNYRAAQSYAGDVLAVEPNHREALDIRQKSASALERFDQALARTRSILTSGDLQGAARALAEARDIDPGSPAVIELAATLAARVRETGTAAQPRTAARDRRVDTPAAPPATSGAAPTPPLEQAAVLPPSAPAPEQPAVNAPVPAAPPATPPVSAPPAPVDPSADGTARGSAPSPSAADDEAAVRRVVSSYARAIESKDLALFRSVKPNLSREEERRLADGFRAVTSQQVRLTPTSVSIHEREASVVAERLDVIDAGGRRQTVQSRQTFQLTRTASGWVIADIR